MSALEHRTILVTGITDASSLALHCARQLQREGARLVCTGLGPTPHHGALSERSAAFLDKTYADFRRTIADAFGDTALALPLDVTLDASLADTAAALRERGIRLDGVLHSIAMDKTIRGGEVKPLLAVTREEFAATMEVSAYSLIALLRALLEGGVLNERAAVVALSYLGAERVVSHPYRNIGVAKAALERIVVELAYELGRSHGLKVNAVRFSPYTESKAGGAIQGLGEAAERCERESPLGNARAEDLAWEVAYLLRPYGRVTGEIRHVDGGYHIRA